ncbi:endonuclease Q family protein [Desmospora profundinema]|uniref:Uncharacterized protein (TIGR00375 family) n=1 Tax=Desmospora profundinema TaxID=1571184 RepID=A0ABU1III3_9BACL|nr:endonuclease Q family protein [Desmospora profundinema]MDR6224585.1 uncharacterized protein (TIGR00375 family) [Desmospora profundinema]
MKTVFADMHIHVGRTESGLPVKITASRSLTFDNILREAAQRKGIDLIGIIDAHSPPVQEEMARGLAEGRYQECAGGGIRFESTTVIPGAEIEVKREGQGAAHLLAYFPHLEAIRQFTLFLSRYVRNPQLSTQRFHGPVEALEDQVTALGGLLVPAHVFTPFKSVYGSAADRLSQVFRPDKLAAVELGLSADTTMADRIGELHPFTFVTNSDAHSLPKIGREYHALTVMEASFDEWKKALLRQEGRRVKANYGLDPKLGKYHRSRCADCNKGLQQPAGKRCPHCGGHVVKGVMDRIEEISDSSVGSPTHRPPYIHQVPLEFIPKLGPKTLDRLVERFGSEMNILHRVSLEEIAAVTHERIAHHIGLARTGQLSMEAGGGGVYGRVRTSRQ